MPLLRLVLLSLPLAGLILYGTMSRRETNGPPGGPSRSEELAVPSDDGALRVPGEAESLNAAPVLVETAATGPLTIDIHPQGRCWVSLTLDGEPAFARVMQAGEREIREAQREIILSVGDAGAFAFAINGQPGHPLGERGEVVTARINRDNYRNFVTQ